MQYQSPDGVTYDIYLARRPLLFIHGISRVKPGYRCYS